ncbi:hypothetical protein AS29_000020 [Bacillus sp. SJS]|nr:hypothetical protein [Bacillus sp. SJS]KZZ86353.1 hypothetical protein AS29_000020 [Bacillus sp. SJS]
MSRYHCCASCKHFLAEKAVDGKGMKYFCKRLGFETKPDYTFHCWDPKNEVIKLMEKRGESADGRSS